MRMEGGFGMGHWLVGDLLFHLPAYGGERERGKEGGERERESERERV